MAGLEIGKGRTSTSLNPQSIPKRTGHGGETSKDADRVESRPVASISVPRCAVRWHRGKDRAGSRLLGPLQHFKVHLLGDFGPALVLILPSLKQIKFLAQLVNFSLLAPFQV